MKVSKRISRLRSRSGQAVVEMVLILALSVFIITMVKDFFVQNEVFANIVSTPWLTLSGVIQNGVPGTPQDTMAKHPNSYDRFNSPVPTEPVE